MVMPTPIWTRFCLGAKIHFLTPPLPAEKEGLRTHSGLLAALCRTQTDDPEKRMFKDSNGKADGQNHAHSI